MNDENDNQLTVICPCCEAALTIDRQTGAILSHAEKKKQLGSFDDMLKGLGKQKETREKLFEQELNAQKERGRLLDQKFREAMKQAENQPPDEAGKLFNPLNLD